jgi:hypothetical protein
METIEDFFDLFRACLSRSWISQAQAFERKVGRRAANRNRLSNIYGKGWPVLTPSQAA